MGFQTEPGFLVTLQPNGTLLLGIVIQKRHRFTDNSDDDFIGVGAVAGHQDRLAVGTAFDPVAVAVAVEGDKYEVDWLERK